MSKFNYKLLFVLLLLFFSKERSRAAAKRSMCICFALILSTNCPETKAQIGKAQIARLW